MSLKKFFRKSWEVILLYSKYKNSGAVYLKATSFLTLKPNDPENNSLSKWSSGKSDEAAFVLDYDGKPGFDAGVSYMFAILELISMWNGTKSQLVSCPKQEKLYFGIMDVEGLTEELAVRSSDGSLPDPSTRGNNSVHDIIRDMKYTSEFKKEDISLEDHPRSSGQDMGIRHI